MNIQNTSVTSVEQITVKHLIDNAYEQFSKSLLSTDGLAVLWGSFSNSDDLARHYFEAKKIERLTDRRRRLSAEEEAKKERIEEASKAAFEYIKWARKKEVQPIWQNALVAYCAAFENCLKSIAVAFLLAENKVNGFEKQIFVPGEEFKLATKTIYRYFRNIDSDDTSRVKFFFETYIQNKNPPNHKFVIQNEQSMVWNVCAEAFLLRNAILHSLSRPAERIEIGEHHFHPNEDIVLIQKDLDTIKNAFQEILEPFDTVTIRLCDL